VVMILIFGYLNPSSSTTKYYYIDVGVNRGDTLRCFIDECPPNANNPHVKPHGDVANYNIIGFEASPYHKEGLASLKDELHSKVNSIDIIMKGASNREHNFTLYEDNDTVHGHWGTTRFANGKFNGKKYEVAAIDFSMWLKRTVKSEDHVILKMNCEGCEFTVLKKMLMDGTLCLIDETYMYFHERIGFKPQDLPSNFATLVRWIAQDEQCGVKFITFSEHRKI